MRPAVLVVDDEPMNRALIRGTIGGFCEVLEAGAGAEALEMLTLRPVDLVLLDVMMPQMNGYEVCQKIKAEAREFLPVILVTALGEQADKNRGLEAGADDFLTKPVDRRELLLRTRAFLRLREQDKVIRRQLEEMQRLQAAKDDLVALLVHDLRSPLAGIVAHLQLLAEDLTGRAANDVQQAMRAADTALARLEETLQVRLLEEGRLPVKRHPVQLDALVRDSVSPMEAVARRKNVRLVRIVQGEPMAPLDENLVKAVPAYEAELKKNNVPHEVHIWPNSVHGFFNDATPAAMFEKFGSVEAKTGARRKGIGLGLYLVKLVAEGHEGSVAVEDRPGGGSVFRLILGAG